MGANKPPRTPSKRSTIVALALPRWRDGTCSFSLSFFLCYSFRPRPLTMEPSMSRRPKRRASSWPLSSSETEMPPVTRSQTAAAAAAAAAATRVTSEGRTSHIAGRLRLNSVVDDELDPDELSNASSSRKSSCSFYSAVTRVASDGNSDTTFVRGRLSLHVVDELSDAGSSRGSSCMSPKSTSNHSNDIDLCVVADPQGFDEIAEGALLRGLRGPSKRVRALYILCLVIGLLLGHALPAPKVSSVPSAPSAPGSAPAEHPRRPSDDFQLLHHDPMVAFGVSGSDGLDSTTADAEACIAQVREAYQVMDLTWRVDTCKYKVFRRWQCTAMHQMARKKMEVAHGACLNAGMLREVARTMARVEVNCEG
ncbi:uncharacterized protein IWZ02DRAFT_163402 [Phyllosticta citriasiana]|uniref:uncharacterized protein n=1 Tax=Phyllosticta citriasiana TaxID=595635 RepID=UPI0030FD7CA6